MQPSYIGYRWPDRCRVLAVDGAGAVRQLGPSQRSARYPSDDWEWGYGGTGPAELAWALIYDATGDIDLAHKFHQALKWSLISRLDRVGWIIPLNDLLTLLVSLAEAEKPEGAAGMSPAEWMDEDNHVIDLAAGEQQGGS